MLGTPTIFTISYLYLFFLTLPICIQLGMLLPHLRLTLHVVFAQKVVEPSLYDRQILVAPRCLFLDVLDRLFYHEISSTQLVHFVLVQAGHHVKPFLSLENGSRRCYHCVPQMRFTLKSKIKHNFRNPKCQVLWVEYLCLRVSQFL